MKKHWPSSNFHLRQCKFEISGLFPSSHFQSRQLDVPSFTKSSPWTHFLILEFIPVHNYTKVSSVVVFFECYPAQNSPSDHINTSILASLSGTRRVASSLFEGESSGSQMCLMWCVGETTMKTKTPVLSCSFQEAWNHPLWHSRHYCSTCIRWGNLSEFLNIL